MVEEKSFVYCTLSQPTLHTLHICICISSAPKLTSQGLHSFCGSTDFILDVGVGRAVCIMYNTYFRDRK